MYPAGILKDNEHLCHDLLLSGSQRLMLPFNPAKTAGSASQNLTMSSWFTIAV